MKKRSTLQWIAIAVVTIGISACSQANLELDDEKAIEQKQTYQPTPIYLEIEVVNGIKTGSTRNYKFILKNVNQEKEIRTLKHLRFKNIKTWEIQYLPIQNYIIALHSDLDKPVKGKYKILFGTGPEYNLALKLIEYNITPSQDGLSDVVEGIKMEYKKEYQKMIVHRGYEKKTGDKQAEASVPIDWWCATSSHKKKPGDKEAEANKQIVLKEIVKEEGAWYIRVEI